MPNAGQQRAPERVVVVMPTWLGDCVMATPTVRALRQLWPDAYVAAAIHKNVRPMLEHCPWVDRLVTIRPNRPHRRDLGRRGTVGLARRLAKGRFDAAVLLPNSFRAAVNVSIASIPRRIGYDRDGRGFMLTDRLLPRRTAAGFVPVPVRDYYLGLARYLGAADPDPTMALFTSPEERQAADDLLRRAGYDARHVSPEARGGHDSPLVVLNPGANRLDKRWPAERFAAVADRLANQWGATVALTGSPGEQTVLEQVAAAAETDLLNLPARGLNLALLKAVMRRADLLITNDTGPRHVAAAVATPVVTLFGPTAPEWTEIGFDRERIVVAPPHAGGGGGTVGRSIQSKGEGVSRSMADIEVETVFDKATELLSGNDSCVPFSG